MNASKVYYSYRIHEYQAEAKIHENE